MKVFQPASEHLISLIPWKNKQDQVSINNFPGLFPFSPKPARGIVISAMVYMCIMVFMNPVCKLTEASVS